jgi:hypothetical protein
MLPVSLNCLFVITPSVFSNFDSNMMSFKRFGSKPVVKYAYIGISADRQRHNLLWLFKYRICFIRIEIIHGGLNIYGFYHGLALYADILPIAIARGRIFGIKGQPVVKSIYIQAPMKYFLIENTRWLGVRITCQSGVIC